MIRVATPADADAIVSVRERSWRAAYADLLDPGLIDRLMAGATVPYAAEQIERRAAAGGVTFLAERDGEPVGYASGGPAREDPTLGELYGLYAVPEVWGSDVGHALMWSVVSHLARSGDGAPAQAVVWTFERNARARRFYAKTGWVPDGERRLQPVFEGEPEVRYRRTLPVVRAPRPEDAAAMASVHVRAWQDGYIGLVPQGYLDAMSGELGERTERWTSWIDAPRGLTHLLAELDEQVVGIATAGRARDADGVGEIWMINVVAAAWGTGAGQALFDAAVETLRAAGYTQAILWVLETNGRARRFYERNGWAADGGVKVDEVQGLPMREVRYRAAL